MNKTVFKLIVFVFFIITRQNRLQTRIWKRVNTNLISYLSVLSYNDLTALWTRKFFVIAEVMSFQVMLIDESLEKNQKLFSIWSSLNIQILRRKLGTKISVKRSMSFQ